MIDRTVNFQPGLIFDVGMHSGEDTGFYLRKGFQVVAVEANPVLSARAEQRFREAVLSGRLTIVPKAVARQPGSVTLWVNTANDEWSSLSQDYVKRNDRVGAGSTAHQVPAIRFAELLQTYGIPYYLKIDIEGMDHLCLESLHEFSCRPRFVSVETSGTNDFEYTFSLLASLYTLGYRKFKLINQYLHHRTRLPNPPLEGQYIEHRFPRTSSSGPFGEETPGSWETIGPIIEKYRRVLGLQARYTVQSDNFRPRLSQLYYRLHRLLRKEPVGWYDIHAKYEAPFR